MAIAILLGAGIVGAVIGAYLMISINDNRNGSDNRYCREINNVAYPRRSKHWRDK